MSKNCDSQFFIDILVFLFLFTVDIDNILYFLLFLVFNKYLKENIFYVESNPHHIYHDDNNLLWFVINKSPKAL